MKNIILLILVCGGLTTHACDVCGCSAGGYTLGLMPGSNRHFIGIGYKWRSFETTHLTLFDDEAPTKSKQIFKTIEMTGRYALHKRIQLYGYLPWLISEKSESGNTFLVNGLGDAIVSAFWSALKQDDSACYHVDRRLLMGLALKVPTGSSNLKVDEILLHDRDMQTGSGSWDALIQMNYTEIHKAWGFSLETSFRRNSANRQHFQFGNRINTLGRFFLKHNMKNQSGILMPFVGMLYEKSGQDIEYNEINTFSGGSLCLAQGGIDITWKQKGLRTSLAIPVGQNLAEGQVKANAQFSATIFYLF